MREWPPLAIVIVTYNRCATLLETIQRLHDHLYYAGPWHVIVADDGSDDGTQAELAARFPHAILVQSRRAGLGANTNAGLRAAFALSPFVLQLQDDMHLKYTFDLHPHIERLTRDETAGMIRLWGIGGHALEGRLEGEHWRVYWHSPDLYIPSDRPQLKHRRFHEHFGMYPEGLPTAATEEAWCHQCKGRAGLEGRQLDVLVPQGIETERNWEHMHWGQRWRDQGL